MADDCEVMRHIECDSIEVLDDKGTAQDKKNAIGLMDI